jgi:dihydroorotase
MYDLLIKGGRVIDPAQRLDAERDLALSSGKIAALENDIPAAEAQKVLDARGLLVTPGLIDIHVHVYEGVSHFGINADATCLNKGVTTAVDTGSSGAGTFPGFRKYIIEVSRTRVLAYLNLSVLGMITECAGELQDLRYADTDAALEIIDSNRDVILGIKVRMEPDFIGENGYEVLKLARATSEAAGLPIMFHIGNTHPPLPDILKETRSGDVITHCFHSRPGGILDDEMRLLPEVVGAVRRGVNFDIGHGRGSFSFEVARRALAQDFPPGTISSDLHAHNVMGPVYDLATTMSKFLYLGLSLNDVIEMSSTRPASVIRMADQLGTLRPGALADVTLLELREEPVELTDAGWDVPVETVTAEQLLVPVGAVRGGELVFFDRQKTGHTHQPGG